MFFSKPASIVFGVAWLIGVLFTMGRFSVEAKSQTVLTILLRDSLGHPLEGVLAEVLSYDWGMPMGEAYGIIARGETDKNGVVAFDNTVWPFSGYRIKFTQPATPNRRVNISCRTTRISTGVIPASQPAD